MSPAKTISKQDSFVYDPEMTRNGVNLSDPEELETYVQVLDVRQRLRSRRQRAIRLFSFSFCILMAALMAGIGLMTHWGESNVEIATAQMGSMGIGRVPVPMDLANKCSAAAIESQQVF
jgi:hypothetical protein